MINQQNGRTIPTTLPSATRAWRVPRLPLSSLGDDWVIGFDICEAFNKAQITGRNRKGLYNQWLASEPTWKYRIDKGWKEERVLGRGGQGIIRYWTYEGPDGIRRP